MTVTEVTHPLARHKLGLLRDMHTSTADFRRLVDELTLLLTYEATKDFATEQVEVETPLERTTVERISGKKVAVCPVLRAGVGMLDGVLSLISGARVGFIGLYRDEQTLQPVEYFVKLPNDIAERDVIVLDPMLATGNSTAAAIETSQGRPVRPRSSSSRSSPRRRASSACFAITPRCESWSPRSTAGSTSTASSCRDSETQATGSSRRNERRRARVHVLLARAR